MASETHMVNAGVPKCSLLGTTLFQLYINDDMPKDILRSLVNIHKNDTTMYRCTYKNLHDNSLAADLSYDLVSRAQWLKTSNVQ